MTEVPLLRNPHPPERPVLATTVPQESVHGSVYGASEGTHLEVVGHYVGERSITSEENTALLGESNSSGQGSSTRPLFVANAIVPAGIPISEKQRLSQQARAREEERRRAVIQHEDADDIVEVPPVYRERA